MRHARHAAGHTASANRASAREARDLSRERDAQSNAIVVRRAPRGPGARQTNVDGGCPCGHGCGPNRSGDYREDRGRDDSARRPGEPRIRARELARVTAGFRVDGGLGVRSAMLAARLERRPRHPGAGEVAVSGGERRREQRHGGQERPGALPPTLLAARSHHGSTARPLREGRQARRGGSVLRPFTGELPASRSGR
jgi:hypothetical protein